MKKTLLISIATTLALSCFADYTGPGYYRVQNYKTKRYVSVIDDKGKINYANTTADLSAIRLQKNFDEVGCDPATVLYITSKDKYYQIETQGTGIYQIISHYIQLKLDGKDNDIQLYNAYGEMSGIIKYLGDAEAAPKDLGRMGTTGKGDYNRWYITPIDPETDNYFGVRPTIENNGKHYLTMYGDFPFSFYSNGVKAYYINKVDNRKGIAVLEEIEGTVPKSTPVLLECESSDKYDNRLNIGGEATAITGNYLRGVYFDNPPKTHFNRVAYDKDTMRILGECSDGKLGFITSETLDYIPANTCYLSVASGSPAEFKIMTPEEYEAGVEDLFMDNDSPKNVFNIHGQPVLRNALPDQINSLPAGIYIVGGKKLVIK